jgi:hypothetical protein
LAAVDAKQAAASLEERRHQEVAGVRVVARRLARGRLRAHDRTTLMGDTPASRS